MSEWITDRLPAIEEHVGEELVCENAWHNEILRLRDELDRQRRILDGVFAIVWEHAASNDPRMAEVADALGRPYTWQEGGE